MWQEVAIILLNLDFYHGIIASATVYCIEIQLLSRKHKVYSAKPFRTMTRREQSITKLPSLARIEVSTHPFSCKTKLQYLRCPLCVCAHCRYLIWHSHVHQRRPATMHKKAITRTKNSSFKGAHSVRTHTHGQCSTYKSRLCQRIVCAFDGKIISARPSDSIWRAQRAAQIISKRQGSPRSAKGACGIEKYLHNIILVHRAKLAQWSAFSPRSSQSSRAHNNNKPSRVPNYVYPRPAST